MPVFEVDLCEISYDNILWTSVGETDSELLQGEIRLRSIVKGKFA